MKIIAEKQKCSGCHACYHICPQGAISMVADEEGFFYPSISEEACVDCGLCQTVCPVLKEYEGHKKGKVYACINKNEGIRQKSSSGAVFTLLAEWVLKQGGVVFGAAFDTDFSVHHVEVSCLEDLQILRGSKYVQSRIGDTYPKIKEYLKQGKTVLFTGTPCQISGLKAYLRKDYDNLILQDLICHGVPSPKVFSTYLTYRQTQAQGKLQKVSFRNKTTGWQVYSMCLEFEDGTCYSKPVTEDAYLRSFVSNLSLRPSCYQCHSKSTERQSDITLADFWGVEKLLPQMTDGKGTSLVFVNTQKGAKLLEAIQPHLNCQEVPFEDAILYNSSMYRSVARPKNREKFMQDIFQKDFETVFLSCSKLTFAQRLKGKIARLVRKLSTEK